MNDFNLVAALDWGTKLNPVVTYGFYGVGNRVTVTQEDDGEVETNTYTAERNWNAWEIGQVEKALQLFSNVANIQFVRANQVASADLRMMLDTYDDSTLGFFMAPEYSTAPGLGVFSPGVDDWGMGRPGGSLEVGGSSFITLMHELGHGLGLAHPHDEGGGPVPSALFPGVNDDGDLGTYALNQGIYTMMSYNDGWVTGPLGRPPESNYGFSGSPMALDVAILQAKYGANTTYRTGDDVYELRDTNGVGTYYSTIWDAGGTNTLAYRGDGDAVINLNAASLKFEPGGGGAVSYVEGVHGGYTIAHGVVIQNAVVGSGDNLVIGNEHDNYIELGRGTNRVEAGAGVDTVRVDGNYAASSMERLEDGVRFTGEVGSQTLIDVDNVWFTDGTLTFSQDTVAAQGYRMYAGLFDRPADGAGLAYWVQAMEEGMSLDVVAYYFLASEEFTGQHGFSLDSAQYLNVLYQDVLGREADDAGYAYWIHKLEGEGAAREAVLAAFTESAEHVQATAELIAGGVWMEGIAWA